MTNAFGVLVSAAVAALAAAPALAQTAPPPAGQLSPAAGYAVSTIEKVCLPVLRGAKTAQAAQAAGFRLVNGAWTLVLAAGRQIQLIPPDQENPHVCSASITTPAATEAQLRQAVNDWAAGQTPKLSLVSTQRSAADDLATSTWVATSPSGQEAVVLSQQTPNPAKPPANGLEQSTLYVSLSPA